MKKIFSGLLVFSVLTAAAQSPKIEFTAPAAYPEGVAYDPANDVFYVSSVRTGTIGKVSAAGMYSPVYTDSALKSTFGMKVEPGGKKLWVMASDPTYSHYRDSVTYKKMIRLIGIDLSTGQKVNDIDLSGLHGPKHFGNDLTLDGKGNIYITDSYAPVIYRVDANGAASVFATSEWFRSAGVGLNGIVWHPGGYLLVANYGNGTLYKVDGSDPRRIGKVQVPQFFPGADGLYLDGESNLLLAQNAGVNKIFKLSSSDAWATAKVVGATRAADNFNYPATITMRRQEAWIMNAKMQELSDSTMGFSEKFAIQQAVFLPVKP